MIKSSKELRYWILGMGLVFSCEIHFLAGSASFFFIEHLLNLDMRMNTVCPRSLDPFYIVSIYKMSKDLLDIQKPFPVGQINTRMVIALWNDGLYSDNTAVQDFEPLACLSSTDISLKPILDQIDVNHILNSNFKLFFNGMFLLLYIIMIMTISRIRYTMSLKTLLMTTRLFTIKNIMIMILVKGAIRNDDDYDDDNDNVGDDRNEWMRILYNKNESGSWFLCNTGWGFIGSSQIQDEVPLAPL